MEGARLVEMLLRGCAHEQGATPDIRPSGNSVVTPNSGVSNGRYCATVELEQCQKSRKNSFNQCLFGPYPTRELPSVDTYCRQLLNCLIVS
jgi:hypothetical protein